MAWSDAARRAALLARQLHRKVRGLPMYNATTSRTARGNMAYLIRDIRRGRSHMDSRAQYNVMRSAAGSTVKRNAARRKRGYIE